MSTRRLSDLDHRWLIEDSAGARLLLSLPGLLPEDQGRELQRLGDAAQAGSLHDTHVYALGFCAVGAFELGIELLNLLAAQYPDHPEIRLNLALAYEHVGLPALALDQLASAVPASAGTKVEEIAKARYAAAMALQREQEEDLRFLHLRAAMLREKDPSAETLRELGLTLFELTRTPGGKVDANDALAVLESAHRIAQDVEVLEHLAFLYMVTGRAIDREQVLQELAAVAPTSQGLASLGEVDEVGVQDILRRKLLLMERLADPEGPPPGAVAELRQLASMFPCNPDYRTLLMHALKLRGEQDEALRVAEELEREFQGVHVVHFAVAQVFWRAGDRERAERHLAEALSTAEDDQDREDVANLRRLLERDAHG
ncbi:hypothetical protein AB0G05_01770 [Nonomuraea wenchangensis]